jgi:hypothetical protein
MYQNPNLPASRFRLATGAGRSAPRSATRGGRSVRRALTMVTLPMVLVGAASYPTVVAGLLTVAVVAFVSRRFVRTSGRTRASDRTSGTELNPTPAAESSS